MLINRNNLAIAALCAKDAIRGFSTNVLRVTSQAATATNNAYAVSVSTLGGKEGPTKYIDPKQALEMKSAINIETGEELESLMKRQSVLSVPADRYPNIEKLFVTDQAPVFEITLAADFLLTLAKSIVDFQGSGNPVRIRFYGEKEAIRFDARNAQGQKWEAILNPRIPGVDAERFAAAEPELSEFEKALKLAESL